MGYRVEDRKLLVDEAEAQTVRLVFERYIALGSLSALQRELRQRGILTRQRTLASGTIRGGVSLTNGPLNHMLRNRMYLGELNHRDSSYPGEHAPIIDRSLFDAVQAKLSDNLHERRSRRSRSDALLTGRLFDDRGNRMSPTYAVKKGLRYRYYVSTMLVQGRKSEAGSVPRVPAAELENIVREAIASTGLPDSAQGMTDRQRVEQIVERVIVRKGSVEIHLTEAAAPGIASPMVIPWSPQPMRRKHEVIGPTNSDGAARPIRAAARSKLLHGIAKGRCWLIEIMTGSIDDIEAIARRESISERAARMTISLAFLAPDIVQAAADGTLPRGFGISRLTDLPLGWAEQRHKLGLPAQA